jgi:hypothetical protein
MQICIFELPPPKARKVVVATGHLQRHLLQLMGEHQTKDSVEDIIKGIKQKIIVTKIGLLEIGITFYFLPMVDQTLNQNHKVGHHKKSSPKKEFTKQPFKDVGY